MNATSFIHGVSYLSLTPWMPSMLNRTEHIFYWTRTSVHSQILYALYNKALSRPLSPRNLLIIEDDIRKEFHSITCHKSTPAAIVNPDFIDIRTVAVIKCTS